jgi:hypothetical protein
MKECYLDGFGSCSDNISREHYISRSVLELISPGEKYVKVQGMSWQKEPEMSIGFSSLQSKILCEKHNLMLIDLDTEAAKFFNILDRIDKNPKGIDKIQKIKGPLFERWLLKVLCGTIISSQWEDEVNPLWKELLLGGKEWPLGWGLYIKVDDTEIKAKKEFFVQTYIDEKKQIAAVELRFAGIPFYLKLNSFYQMNGTYRPCLLDFINLKGNKISIHTGWTSEHVVTYQKIRDI